MRRLGRSKQKGKETFSVPWLLGGVALGIGGWTLYRHLTRPTGTGAVDETVAFPLPSVASPLRFADLRSVDIRRDQVKTLYQSGKLTPEQALAELDGLSLAAASFSEGDPVTAGVIEERIEDFRSDILEFLEFKRTQTMSGFSVSLRRIQ